MHIISFTTRFGTAFIRQTSLSLLIKKSNVKRKRRSFPNEKSLERYLVTLFEDYNFKQSQRIHKDFDQRYDTLESFFD